MRIEVVEVLAEPAALPAAAAAAGLDLAVFTPAPSWEDYIATVSANTTVPTVGGALVQVSMTGHRSGSVHTRSAAAKKRAAMKKARAKARQRAQEQARQEATPSASQDTVSSPAPSPAPGAGVDAGKAAPHIVVGEASQSDASAAGSAGAGGEAGSGWTRVRAGQDVTPTAMIHDDDQAVLADRISLVIDRHHTDHHHTDQHRTDRHRLDQSLRRALIWLIATLLSSGTVAVYPPDPRRPHHRQPPHHHDRGGGASSAQTRAALAWLTRTGLITTNTKTGTQTQADARGRRGDGWMWNPKLLVGLRTCPGTRPGTRLGTPTR
ncbi:hypothetical protein [Pseudonocardia sp. ICBG162]|uniref:hypothetical protein n=1 Tax=Pseudonocardia sp. ICBG162 TaxID=2846761 RepID=UPI001CF6E630|nr:hypothetical protein [Pseudonocardia sp. ICBG162]